MQYAGMIKQSLVDYPGEIATVLFTRGCNMRCPFCHNPDLLIKPRQAEKPLDIDEVVEFLLQRRGFLDGVVFSGGEPTLNPELLADMSTIKALGFLVKLDTNGTNTVMLEEMLREGCLDYVAMDIKAPLDYKKYKNVCGQLSVENFWNVRSTVILLKDAPVKVEFRTTVVPPLHSAQDIVEIAQYIEGADVYTLQQFNPRVTLDPGYSKVLPYNKDEMQAIVDQCAPYVKGVRVINI